jgi:AcrR family transcriptional regulator
MPAKPSIRAKTNRLAPQERHRILLDKAIVFFAEAGMQAPTRALAEACGVAQRLLYRYFPSKSVLLDEVYEKAILAPFKSIWLLRLQDRSLPIEQRLLVFFEDYYQSVLSRQWIRLFLFAGLDNGQMTGSYIDTIVKQLLEAVVQEAAWARGVTLPHSAALRHEIGWVLHGAVSHLAIRQHVYGASQTVKLGDILQIQIAAFLDGLASAAASACSREAASVPVATTENQPAG